MTKILRNFRAKCTNGGGFTLAELLIVVAIIAVMVAIAIPTFGSQLEKSREGTDISNIRAAYAEISALALTEPDTNHTASVPLVQTQSGWQTTGVKIANLAITTDTLPVAKNDTVPVTYTAGTDGTGVIKIGNNPVTSSFTGAVTANLSVQNATVKYSTESSTSTIASVALADYVTAYRGTLTYAKSGNTTNATNLTIDGDNKLTGTFTEVPTGLTITVTDTVAVAGGEVVPTGYTAVTGEAGKYAKEATITLTFEEQS